MLKINDKNTHIKIGQNLNFNNFEKDFKVWKHSRNSITAIVLLAFKHKCSQMSHNLELGNIFFS